MTPKLCCSVFYCLGAAALMYIYRLTKSILRNRRDEIEFSQPGNPATYHPPPPNLSPAPRNAKPEKPERLAHADDTLAKDACCSQVRYARGGRPDGLFITVTAIAKYPASYPSCDPRGLNRASTRETANRQVGLSPQRSGAPENPTSESGYTANKRGGKPPGPPRRSTCLRGPCVRSCVWYRPRCRACFPPNRAYRLSLAP